MEAGKPEENGLKATLWRPQRTFLFKGLTKITQMTRFVELLKVHSLLDDIEFSDGSLLSPKTLKVAVFFVSKTKKAPSDSLELIAQQGDEPKRL